VGSPEPEALTLRAGTTNAEAGEYEDVAALYTAAAPRTEPERALVVGYWFQVHQGMKDFDSQRVNAELKNMGHGVGNITEAFSRLIGRKPQYVIQTRKSGTARQARKLYRVTNEGIKRVKAMLAGQPEDAAE
jgi:Tfp pilus assembly protein PilX